MDKSSAVRSARESAGWNTVVAREIEEEDGFGDEREAGMKGRRINKGSTFVISVR